MNSTAEILWNCYVLLLLQFQFFMENIIEISGAISHYYGAFVYCYCLVCVFYVSAYDVFYGSVP